MIYCWKGMGYVFIHEILPGAHCVYSLLPGTISCTHTWSGRIVVAIVGGRGHEGGRGWPGHLPLLNLAAFGSHCECSG